jgi:chromatin remodeling complex protein RSC6
MATTTIETVKVDISSSEHLKTVLLTLTEQQNVIKGLINTVRSVLKDSDKQSKELEKLRNKRTRVKTERSADALPSGITKPVAITDELAKFLGVAPGTLVPRNEVTKGVSGYVKKNDISDPTNKQKFVLDDRPAAKVLRTLLGNPTEDVTYFNLQKYLKHHYIMNPDATPAAPKKVKKIVDAETPSTSKVAVSSTTTPPVVVAADGEKKKVIKKVVVKKKTELAEEA